MSTYKTIFVNDSWDDLEAGAQVMSVDGSVAVFGESAFASLEDAVAAAVTNAVIRIESGKYESTDSDGNIQFYIADSKGNVTAASQVVFVDFSTNTGLSYDNGTYTRSVNMTDAGYSDAEKQSIIDKLNEAGAADGIVYTAAEPAAGTSYSTVYVGSTDDFDDISSTLKGISETVDTGNVIADDEAFVNTDNISSLDELVQVIDHEVGHLTGEAHPVTTNTIQDYMDTITTHQSVLSTTEYNEDRFEGISHDGNGAAVEVKDTGTMNGHNLTFENNTAQNSNHGGAIYNSGIVNLQNDYATFTNNVAGGTGGAIYNASGATVTINSSPTFSGNTAAQEGGAIYNAIGGTFSINNNTSIFTGNTSADNGGAIYNAGTFSMQSGTFAGNAATGTSLYAKNGGAIYNGSQSSAVAEFSMNSGTFTGNTAQWGGAIYNGTNAKFTINNGTFIGNTAYNYSNPSPTGGAGAIYNGGTFSAGNLYFSGNSSEYPNQSSGAILNNSVGDFYFSGTITLATASDTIRNEGELYWNLVGGSTESHAQLSLYNEDSFTNSGTLYIVVDSANVTAGDYTIVTMAQGTANYESYSFSVTNKYWYQGLGTLSLTASVTDSENNKVYSLTQSGNNLVLTVETIDTRIVVNGGTHSTLTEGKSYHAASYSGNGGAAYVYSGGTLSGANNTFKGNTATGTGASGGAIYNAGSVGLTGTSAFTNNAVSSKGGAVYNSGSFTMEGGTFSGNKETGTSAGYGGGAVHNYGGATFIATDTLTFSDNSASFGGAIYNNNNSASFSMKGGTFTGNTATNGGGGAIYNYGNFTATDTLTFTENVSKGGVGGGAISNASMSSTFTMKDGTFTGNTATNGGGAIYNEGTFTATNLAFTGNTAGSNGGAIYNTGMYGTINMQSGTFTGNTATGTSDATGGGGAIYNSSTFTMTAGDVAFTGNFAKESNGGAIYNSSTFTMAGGTFTGNSASYKYDTYTGRGGAIYNYSYTGNFTATDTLTFNGNSAYNGGAIYNDGSATFTMAGGTFSGNTAAYLGGAIVNTGDASFTASDTLTFSGNTAGGDGGAIYNEQGTFTMQGGTFSSNVVAGDYGSGGAINNSSTFTANGDLTFTGNTVGANGNGGAIANGASFTMAGGTFTGNTAGSNGGAVYNAGSGVTFTMAGGTFSSNYAKNNGGAIYNTSSFTATDALTFSGNTAVEQGGAIYNNNNFTMAGGTFSNNLAQKGGAVYNDTGSTFTMTGGTFSNNIAGVKGGAIMNAGTFSASGDLTFSGNTATGTGNNGGGAAVFNSGSFTMQNGFFTDNTATTYGGAIYNSSTFTMAGGTFTGNYVADGGGAIMNVGTFSASGDLTFTGNSASGSNAIGGAVYNSGSFTMKNGTFTGNSATYGGAIASGDCEGFTMENGTFTGNSATIGGAIYNGAPFSMKGGTFSNNVAASDGGAICNDIVFTATDTLVFTGNSAGGNGGAIFNAGTFNFSKNLTLNTASDTIYNESGATLNWDLTGGTDSHAQLNLFNDSSLTNNGTLAITVKSSGQDDGDYTIVTGGTNYDSYTFTVKASDDSFSLSGLSLTNSISGGGKMYSLKVTDNDLILTIQGRIVVNDGSTKTLTTGANYSFGGYDGNGGAAEVTNGTLTATGDVAFSANSASTYGGAIYNEATISLAGGTFTGNTGNLGGAVYNKSGSFTMADGTFTGNYATYTSGASGIGGAIYNIGTFSMGNGTFSGNTAGANSGAIANTGSFSMAGGTFTDNVAAIAGAINNAGTFSVTGSSLTFTGNTATNTQFGGGAVVNMGTFSMAGGSFSNNVAGGTGGAIYNAATFTATDTLTFSANSAAASGGAVYNSGSFSMAGGSFSNNVATGTGEYDGGGAIYNRGTFSASGDLTFSGNTSTGSGGNAGGGAIFNNAGTISLQNAVFTGNSAATNGGAVYNYTSSTFSMAGGTFTNNVASSAGGAVYNMSSSTFSATDDLTFTGNTASGNKGGAIYNTGTVKLADGTFTNNVAGSGGAGAIYNSGNFTMDSGTFTGNTAKYSSGKGGAIYNYGGGVFTANGDLTFTGNTAGNGGAIAQDKGNNTFTATNGDLTFSGNTATNGGAIYNAVNDGTSSFTMTGGTFSNNIAGGTGGAIYNQGNFTATDTLTFSGNSAKEYGGAIYNYGASATFSMAGGTFTGNTAASSGGVLYNASNATFTASGDVSFIGNTSKGYSGGAISNTGTVTLAGTSLFSGNSVLNQGGAIYNYGNFTMAGGTFSGNVVIGTSSYDGNGGGAINNYSSGTFKATDDLTFSANSSAASGGAVYSYGCGSISLQNATFTGNSAAKNGGAIYNASSGTVDNTFTMAGGTFSGNSAGASGGAIYNGAYGVFTATDTLTFSGNSASVDGGAVYNSGSFTMKGGTFSGNTSGSDGGVIANAGTGKFTATGDLTFSENMADKGGAIVNTGSFSMKNGTFTGNTTGAEGGVIINNGSFSMAAGEFTGNSAGDVGGAIQNVGTFTATDALIFSANSASGDGGAIANAGMFSAGGDLTFTGNTTAANGGAISNLRINETMVGTISMAGGEFSNNIAGGTGGAIYNAGTFTATDALTFTGNSSATAGGAVYNSGVFTANDALTFSNNIAGGTGGAIFNAGTFNFNNTMTLMHETDTVYNASGATLNWDISNGTGSYASVRGFNYVTNDGTFTITVKGDGTQETGDYTIATEANSAYTGSFTLTGVSDTTQVITVDETVSYGDQLYTLLQTNNNLVLTVKDYNERIVVEGGSSELLEANGVYTAKVLAGTSGGMVEVQAGGTLGVDTAESNVTFKNNGVTDANGGAIYNAGSIGLVNATFTGNSATGSNTYGGAIYNDTTGTFSLTGTNVTFDNNSADTYGGAISNAGTISMQNATFTGNSANTGGAIYSYGSEAEFTANGNLTFIGNTATGEYGAGGAIYNGGTSSFSMQNGIFMNNTAASGGAITNKKNSTFTMGSGTFTGNTAVNADAGGGGAIENKGLFEATGDLIFTNNLVTSGNGGGAILNMYNGGTFSMGNGTFTGNTSATNGGAIANEGIFTASGDLTFSGNTSATNGGAIYNGAGTFSFAKSLTLVTATDTIYNASGATLNWDITGGTASYAQLNGYDYLTNAGTLTITVTGDNTQNAGEYTIATGVYNALTSANKTFTVKTEAGVTAGSVTVGGDLVTYNGYGYKLAQDTTNLVLTISKVQTDKVLVSAGTTHTDWDLTLGGGTTGGDPISAYSVTGTGAVEVKDDGYAFGTDLVFDKNTNTSANGGAILNAGSLSLTNATFTGNSATTGNGGAIYNSGSASLSGVSVFSGNTATDGAAIYNSGSFSLAGGTFTNNVGSTSGAIYNSGSFTASDTLTFSGNTAPTYGANAGGAAISNSGTFSMADGTFTNNVASSGAIFNGQSGTFSMGDGTFSGNTATLSSGGAIINRGKFTMEGGTFTNNVVTDADSYGGAIENSVGTFTATGAVTFSGNSAGKDGDAITNVATMVFQDTVSVTGLADSTHAMVLNDSSGKITFEKSATFSGNSSGVAIKNNAANSVINFNDSATFTGNSGAIINAGTINMRGTLTTDSAITNTGTLNWDLSSNGAASLAGYSYLSNSGTLTITVDDTQTTGIYTIATGATTNTDQFTITGVSGLDDKTITVGEDEIVYNNLAYKLTFDGSTGNITLNISKNILYMGGETRTLTTDSIYFKENGGVYLAYAPEGKITPVEGAQLTVTPGTSSANVINFIDGYGSDDKLYGTLIFAGTTGDTANEYTIGGTQARIAAKVINIEAGATVDAGTAKMLDFDNMVIGGTLEADFTKLNSPLSAGTVSGSGSLNITTAGEWIINDDVDRDFTQFGGTVSMTGSTASITMGQPYEEKETRTTAYDHSYFGDGATVIIGNSQSVNLAGGTLSGTASWKSTGIIFKSGTASAANGGTINVLENHTLTADNSDFLGTAYVSEGRTLQLTGNFGGSVDMDKENEDASTKLILGSTASNGGTVTVGGSGNVGGTIKGDGGEYADIVEIQSNAKLNAAGALDNFSGTVSFVEGTAKTLELSGTNSTAATFAGGANATVDVNGSTLSLSGNSALDNFSGTIALDTNKLVLSGTNSTGAVFTGGDNATIDAKANQTFSGDNTGFGGTLSIFEGNTVTLKNTFGGDVDMDVSGETAGQTALVLDEDNLVFGGTVKGDSNDLIDVKQNAELSNNAALTNFGGTVAVNSQNLTLSGTVTDAEKTSAVFTGAAGGTISVTGDQNFAANDAISSFGGTVSVADAKTLTLGGTNSTAATFAGNDTATVAVTGGSLTLNTAAALNQFGGTMALNGNVLNLNNTNETDAKFTGVTGGTINANYDQTFKADGAINGFSGTVSIADAKTLTLSGVNTTGAIFAGAAASTIDANADLTLNTAAALNQFGGTVSLENYTLTLNQANNTSATFTGDADGTIDVNASQTFSKDNAITGFSGTIALDDNTLTLGGTNSTAAKFTGGTTAVIDATANQTFTGNNSGFKGTAYMVEGGTLTLEGNFGGNINLDRTMAVSPATVLNLNKDGIIVGGTITGDDGNATPAAADIINVKESATLSADSALNNFKGTVSLTDAKTLTLSGTNSTAAIFAGAAASTIDANDDLTLTTGEALNQFGGTISMESNTLTLKGGNDTAATFTGNTDGTIDIEVIQTFSADKALDNFGGTVAINYAGLTLEGTNSTAAIFTGGATNWIDAKADQTFSKDGAIDNFGGTVSIADAKTLTLSGTNSTDAIFNGGETTTIDANANLTLGANDAIKEFSGTIALESNKLTLNGTNSTAATFTGDAAGSMDVNANQTFSKAGAINGFNGTVSIANEKTLTLSGVNTTNAIFNGAVASTIDADADLTLGADKALDAFGGTIALDTLNLTLNGTNSTAATFTGAVGGTINVNQDQTFSKAGAINGYSGTVSIAAEKTLTLNGANETNAIFNGTSTTTIDANDDLTLGANDAIKEFGGTITMAGNKLTLNGTNSTAATFTGDAAGIIDVNKNQTFSKAGAINGFNGTVELEGNTLTLGGVNTTAAKFTSTDAAAINALDSQTFKGDNSGFTGTVNVTEGKSLTLENEFGGNVDMDVSGAAEDPTTELNLNYQNLVFGGTVKGDSTDKINVQKNATMSNDKALTNFGGTVGIGANALTLSGTVSDVADATNAIFTSDATGKINIDGSQYFKADKAIESVAGTISLGTGQTLTLGGTNSTAASFTGNGSIEAKADQTFTGSNANYTGKVTMAEGTILTLQENFGGSVDLGPIVAGTTTMLKLDKAGLLFTNTVTGDSDDVINMVQSGTLSHAQALTNFGGTVSVNANTVTLSGDVADDKATSAKFTSSDAAATIAVTGNQNFSANDAIKEFGGTISVADAKTLTLGGTNSTAAKFAGAAASTINAEADQTFSAAEALNQFSGTVSLNSSTLSLSSTNSTNAKFTGLAASAIDANANQTFSAEGALNGFGGTVVLDSYDLTLGSANETAAKFTGTTDSIITASANQTLTGASALNGFGGTIAMGANNLILKGQNDTSATITGSGIIRAVNANQTLSGDLSGFTGGTIDANGTSVVTLSGTISGGTSGTLNLMGNQVVLNNATPVNLTINSIDTGLTSLTAYHNHVTIDSGTITNVTSTNGNIILTGGTVSNATSTNGDINLKNYANGSLSKLKTTNGNILLTSAKNITVSSELSGDITYTVTEKQTDNTADLTFTGGALNYSAYAVTVNMTSALVGVGEQYKLMTASGTLTFGSNWGISLSVDGGTTSYELKLGGNVQIDDKLYWLKVDNTSNTLYIDVMKGAGNTMYVNDAWNEPIGNTATDNFYYPSDTKTRYVGSDAAKTIDKAVSYLKANTSGTDIGKGTIELTENATYSTSTELGTTANGVTNMTLRARSNNADTAYHATVQGTVNAGKAKDLTIDHLTVKGSVVASTEATGTLTFNHSSVTGNVTGNGSVEINGNSKNTGTGTTADKTIYASKFTGISIAAGGTLTVNGGIITVRDLVGGKINAAATGDTSVTINGCTTAEMVTYISSTVYGGSVVNSGSVTQSGTASVTVDVSGGKATLAGDIYAAGQALSGTTLNVSGNRTVTFKGSAANLSFNRNVSGGAQGSGTINYGSTTANLVFDSFNCSTKAFNGSISGFNTITLKGDTQLQLGRRQTQTATTDLNFTVTSATGTANAMYTLRDANTWEFSKSIAITIDGAGTGTYTLVAGDKVGFAGFSFTVNGSAIELGGSAVQGCTLTYENNELKLTYNQPVLAMCASPAAANDSITINDTFSANADASKITGVAALSSDVSGVKNLGSVDSMLDKYTVDGTEVSVDGSATQVAGASTKDDTSDDVWAKLTNSDNNLIVSWGKTEEQVTGALDAYENSSENKVEGFTLTATSTDLADGISNDDYKNKNGGTLA